MTELASREYAPKARWTRARPYEKARRACCQRKTRAAQCAARPLGHFAPALSEDICGLRRKSRRSPLLRRSGLSVADRRYREHGKVAAVSALQLQAALRAEVEHADEADRDAQLLLLIAAQPSSHVVQELREAHSPL